MLRKPSTGKLTLSKYVNVYKGVDEIEQAKLR